MRSLCLLLAVGGMVGCTAGPADAQSEGRARYFVSPMGELFRSEGNDRSPHQVWFGAADLDGNGSLDLREFQIDALRFFRLLDADMSGEIDPNEITRYQTEMVPEAVRQQTFGSTGGSAMARREGSSGDRSGNQRVRQRSGSGSGATASSDPIARADSDSDGKITLEEFMLAAEERWRDLDSNQDGRLLLQEAASNLGTQTRSIGP